MHTDFNVHKQSVILHAVCNFQTQCDFDTPEYDYDTYKWDFNTHKSDFYTQSVMLTRMSVIMTLTKVIMTRGGLVIVAMRQLPRGFCNLPYKMSKKEAFEEF
jgi:hypothetical protein